eukprot:CAMPEP_0183732182 /NCGR_PEP_ID=MMETSP0737-20130205/37722_1 /TAXON_ID=385413 /ORGANISM="Thalassiosira miniscula, Strain CCMP1093" /LENGTH=742 /DNA_ID=CAMNT_0025965111 /DNA_START=1 /DNA_END=2226 /DNA_ORIENTATION=+
MPMDWAPLTSSDDSENGVIDLTADDMDVDVGGLRLDGDDGRGYCGNDGNNGNGDSRSLICYEASTMRNGSNNDQRNSANYFGNIDRGADNSNQFDHRENHPHSNGATINSNATAVADHNNRNGESFLRVAERYMEQSNQYFEQQQLAQKKRERIKRVTIILVAVIAIVLKRHAPPPPPIWNQSPLASSTFSVEDSDGMVADTETTLLEDSSVGNDTPKVLEITQHETWAGYSRHLLCLAYHASAYGLFVAWYTISNAFVYAAEEAREGFDVLLSGCDDGESLLNIWKKKLMSFGNGLKQIWTSNNEHESRHNSQTMADVERSDKSALQTNVPCPIRIPAANNLHTHLPRGASTHDTIHATSITTMEGWSTEDHLRQTIGTSLSPQNLALKVIAEGMDAWGESLIQQAPVAVVHNMATAVSLGSGERYLDDDTLSSWILPPSMGFLLVGPEGVGKLHSARRMARLLLGHCLEGDGSTATEQQLEGVLEVIGSYYNPNDGEEVHPIKETIVNHIRSREGLGAVVIIHHIELIPSSILSDISRVLDGKTDVLSYSRSEEVVEASCNGTVFVITSKQWGTKSIFRHIQKNDGVSGLHRETLTSSIRWEVDSHLDYWTKLASQITIVPFLPFEQEDLASILQSQVQKFNRKYQGVYWSKLEVSHAVIKQLTSVEHVEYLDLYNANDGEEEEGEEDTSLVTFSFRGARALDDNAPWRTLRTRLTTGTRRRPGMILRLDLDDDGKEMVW